MCDFLYFYNKAQTPKPPNLDDTFISLCWECSISFTIIHECYYIFFVG